MENKISNEDLFIQSRVISDFLPELEIGFGMPTELSTILGRYVEERKKFQEMLNQYQPENDIKEA